MGPSKETTNPTAPLVGRFLIVGKSEKRSRGSWKSWLHRVRARKAGRVVEIEHGECSERGEIMRRVDESCGL